MKRIIDWSIQENTENTTGWSPSLVANYISALAIAGNESWKAKIKSNKITLADYQAVTQEILLWTFPDHVADDLEKCNELADQCWKAAKRTERCKFNDTVFDGIQERKFRASPVLRSIIVHIGAAEFEAAEYDVRADAEVTYPKNLDVAWNESWTNFRGIEFKGLLGFIKGNTSRSVLEVIVGEESFLLCPTAVAEKNAPPRAIQPEGSVDDIAPKWGSGRYLLFYGPPGTGKTRAANKLIQDALVGQLETHSSGAIRKEKLSGEWASEFRATVMRELRKFTTVCQFHPTYSYEDFIEGLRPLPGESAEIRYEVVDGSFMAIWRKATGRSANLKANFIEQNGDYFVELDSYFIQLYDLDVESSVHVFLPVTKGHYQAHHVKGSNWLQLNITPDEFKSIPSKTLVAISIKGESWSPDNQYYILIDEINRAKVSKVFGELLFAMSASTYDKYPEVRTQYSKTPLLLVENLHLLGTMNSCDKSVDVLDQALKRRFELRELMPLTEADMSQDENWRKMITGFQDRSKINLASFLDELNRRILESKEVDYDRQIGHSFIFKMNSIAKQLMPHKSKEQSDQDLCLRAVFKTYFSDIFPVLQDFFIDRRDTLVKFVPRGFLTDDSFALAPEIRRLVSTESPLDYGGDDWAAASKAFIKYIEEFRTRGFEHKKPA